MEQRLLGERELRVTGLRPGTDARHALVHGRGRVRHRTHNGHAVGDALLDVLRPDRGGDRQHGLVGREQRADLGEQRVDVLRLHCDDDELCAAYGVRVRRRRLDAVPPAQSRGAASPGS